MQILIDEQINWDYIEMQIFRDWWRAENTCSKIVLHNASQYAEEETALFTTTGHNLIILEEDCTYSYIPTIIIYT